MSWSRTYDEELLVASLTVTEGESLADNSDVSLIVDSFNEHRVYAMALTNDLRVLDNHGYDRLMVLPYRLLGTGQAFDGEQRQAVLAFVHDDQDSAIENAARLDAILASGLGSKNVPYSDTFASFDISVDGVLVSVVLNLVSPNGGGFWVHSLMVEDPLYWSDGG